MLLDKGGSGRTNRTQRTGQTEQGAALGLLPGASHGRETKGTETEPPSQGVAQAAPGRAQEPPLLGQARPGSRDTKDRWDASELAWRTGEAPTPLHAIMVRTDRGMFHGYEWKLST
jgi:hypothetical protein